MIDQLFLQSASDSHKNCIAFSTDSMYQVTLCCQLSSEFDDLTVYFIRKNPLLMIVGIRLSIVVDFKSLFHKTILSASCIQYVDSILSSRTSGHDRAVTILRPPSARITYSQTHTNSYVGQGNQP